MVTKEKYEKFPENNKRDLDKYISNNLLTKENEISTAKFHIVQTKS